MRRLALVGVTAALGFLVAAAALAGPAGQYVLITGDQENAWVVQGTGVVGTWSTAPYAPYPVAVLGTILTTGSTSGNQGAEYTLAGVPTGTLFTNGLPGGHEAWDATTDGTNIYVIDWTTGNVTRLDMTWSNPQVLFSPGAAGTYLGITYDPTNNSLWVAGWTTGTIADYTLTGTPLSSFTVPFAALTCLAMDYSDNTLWFGSQSTEGTFYQYSRAGASLGTQAYPALAAQNTLGGEFALSATPREPIPAASPAVLLLLAVLIAGAGLALLHRRAGA